MGAIERLVDEATNAGEIREFVETGNLGSTCRAREGMMEQRSALPVRSPMPLMVPWISPAPALAADTELATAIPQSL